MASRSSGQSPISAPAVSPSTSPGTRVWFYKRCDHVLDRLALDPDDRAKIDAQLATDIPRPSDKERAAAFRPPDGFTALVNAWNAASEAEQRRFLGSCAPSSPCSQISADPSGWPYQYHQRPLRHRR